MRYIQKGVEPRIIRNYRNLRQAAGQAVTYADFPQIPDLNAILREEQKDICCYCMQRIDHYQAENEAGSHNEHLVPQKGPNGNPALQLNYGNLYACCNYTKDYPQEDSYCGWHKDDDLITNFIQQPNCRAFFKYNTIGEILPNGAYETAEEYLINQNILPLQQLNALNTITVLNLNQTILKQRRYDLIHSFLPNVRGLTQGQANAKIQRIVHRNPLPPFVEVIIYYLHQV